MDKILLLFLSLVLTIRSDCPLNTIESVLYSSCYLFSHVRLRWSAAEAVCNLYGGHLTSIRSKEHETFLTTTFFADKYDNAWIGASYFKEQWQWSDGKTFSYNDFKNKTQPTNTSVGLFVDNFPLPVTWQFMDDDDQTLNAFICEMPRCKNGQSGTPLITPNDKNSYIFFADKAQKWFVTSHSIFDEAEVLESEKKCSAILSHLPSISNEAENEQFVDWLSKITTKLSYMPIGYRTTMGQWVWTDWSQSTYTNWAGGQPQPMKEDLVTLVNIKTGRWYSQDNTQSNNEYVCEFPLNKNYCGNIQMNLP